MKKILSMAVCATLAVNSAYAMDLSPVSKQATDGAKDGAKNAAIVSTENNVKDVKDVKSAKKAAKNIAKDSTTGAKDGAKSGVINPIK